MPAWVTFAGGRFGASQKNSQNAFAPKRRLRRMLLVTNSVRNVHDAGDAMKTAGASGGEKGTKCVMI